MSNFASSATSTQLIIVQFLNLVITEFFVYFLVGAFSLFC